MIDDDAYRATPAVWFKRVFQLPQICINWRTWTLGVSWAAPEDEGFFNIHLGPVGLCWDMWP